MASDDTVQLTIRVPAWLRDRLNSYALSQRRSANTTATIILEDALGVREDEQVPA